MKKTSLFATDFDGTLLRDDGSFDSRDLSSLETLRAKGCAVVLASGRSPVSLEKCLNGYNLPVDWYVLSSGAGVLNSSGKVTMSRTLFPEDTYAIYSAFANLGITDISIQGVFPDAHILLWMEGKHCLDFQRRLAYYKPFSRRISKPDVSSSEVIGFVEPEQADFIVSRLEESIGGKYSVIRATSPIDNKTVWVEVFAGGVNKASACDTIRKDLDIAITNTAAVGNDWNDIHLLRWAGRSFVSLNAPEPLLREFEHVPSNQNNAVASAVEKWQMELI
jgi:HAD superfamily hydrolase (TIGR01484 family)